MMETGNEFLIVGLLLAFALFAGRVAASLGLPRVAAYLLVGVVFSPDLLGDRLELQIGVWAEGFTTGALGVIAYLIGGSITMGQLRRMGRIIVGSTLGESLGAMLMVFVCMWGLLSLQSGSSVFPLAMAFSVLAVSTAPAATLAVIHQYRTKGTMTDTLLGVVVLDDAVGIICFSVLLAVVADNTLTGTLTSAVIQIAGAILVGATVGVVLKKVSTYFGESGMRLPLVLSAILLVLGIAHRFDLSLLLSAMSLGFFTRLYTRASAHRLFNPIYNLEEMIFILFFSLAGTHFDFNIFHQYIDLILMYVIARVFGKAIGSAVGTRIAGAPDSVVRWLGFGLVPQAGVAVGLALILSHQAAYADTGHIIVNVILGTTLLYELVGPLTARFALERAGELHIKREKPRHEGF